MHMSKLNYHFQALFSFRILLLFIVAISLTACPGESSSPAVNRAPVVFAGADFTIGLATVGVPLTATITDPDGNTVTIQWTFTAFAASALTPPGAAAGIATFVSGSTSAAAIVTLTTTGLYTFQVTASDGTLSASDQVVVDFTNELVGILPASLKDVQAPVNPDIFTGIVTSTVNTGLPTYIKDNAAAIKLGKALFWDEQVGSDSKQACASCHFHAGTNNRIKNTASQGSNGTFDLPFANPNYTLKSADFPLHKFNDPEDRFSGVLSSSDDIVGAEGVFDRKFNGLTLGSALEKSVANPVFPDAKGFVVGGVNVRRVTGRNTPTTINAVFNLRNFHDGRARHHFNGANPFGNLDPVVTNSATTPILTVSPLSTGGTGLSAQHVVAGLDRSSLASQAVGPPLSDFEMSHGNPLPPGVQKSFPDLGKKLLNAGIVPLGQQLVHPNDSVLGLISGNPIPGIADTYVAMIKAAFYPEVWESIRKFTFDAVTGLPVEGAIGVPAVSSEYTLMEVNFSLIFGLAVQAYEATLVADDSRFDQFLGAVDPYNRTTGVKTGVPIAANQAALTAQEKAGMSIFFGKGLCFNCHGGPELTLAGVNALGLVGVPGEVPEFPVEKMVGGQFGQQAAVEFATAGVTADPGVIPLTFDPRGKRVEIRKGAVKVYEDIFPGVPNPACVPQQLAIGMTPVANPPIGGVAGAAYAELPGCSGRTFSVALAQSITNPPTFPPIADYSVNIFDAAGTLVKSAPISITLTPILYDLGFYNLGVRPTAEDLDVGGTAPSGFSLSFVRRAKATGISEFPLNPGINLTTDPISNVDGAFKVPGLRNVELTGPYLHNGGKSTLLQVVNHYDLGADFHEANIVDLAPDMVELFLSTTEKNQLVAFLKALTDERVRNESAPFDHPQLHVVHGQVGDDISVGAGPAVDIIDTLPAVGALARIIHKLGFRPDCEQILPSNMWAVGPISGM